MAWWILTHPFPKSALFHCTSVLLLGFFGIAIEPALNYRQPYSTVIDITITFFRYFQYCQNDRMPWVWTNKNISIPVRWHSCVVSFSFLLFIVQFGFFFLLCMRPGLAIRCCLLLWTNLFGLINNDKPKKKCVGWIRTVPLQIIAGFFFIYNRMSPGKRMEIEIDWNI